MNLSAVVLALAICCAADIPDLSEAPGVVIDHQAASTGQYIGSPGIAVLADGSYLAKDDRFGPKQPEPTLTRVFRSADRGKSWQPFSDVHGMTWASIFVHRGAVYLFGTDAYYGRTVIMKSADGGKTWSEPKDGQSGLLAAEGQFHTAPTPIVEHGGRIWRAMEDAMGPGGWGTRFRAFMMSAPADADLLRAESWTSSNVIARDATWLDNTFGGWLEGNAVLTQDGHLVDMLRVHNLPAGEMAAIVRIGDDGKTATFDPAKDFVAFPGGTKKFSIHFDPQSKRYWSLSNYVPPRHRGPAPDRVRNTLALISSPDLRTWELRCVLLYHPDTARHGFQYVDWLFDGDDIIAVCRTACDDGLGGAHNAHDANFLTFHRIDRFRTRTMADSTQSWSGAVGR